MKKPGISIDIPGLGRREIHTVVSDYTGTLSCKGKLVSGVKERLLKLQDLVEVKVVTSDSYGTAEQELQGVLTPDFLTKKRHDFEKQDYVGKLDPQH